MWREFIHSLEPAALFADKASENQLIELQVAVNVTLPADLEDFLKECDGSRDQYGFCIVWSIEEIKRYKEGMREIFLYKKQYKPLTDLLFFADAGNGDRFAFPIIRGECQQGPIFSWDHEDDTRKVVASSLKSYLEGWLSGKMSV